MIFPIDSLYSKYAHKNVQAVFTDSQKSTLGRNSLNVGLVIYDPGANKNKIIDHIWIL
jgi:hypothetical protein